MFSFLNGLNDGGRTTVPYYYRQAMREREQREHRRMTQQYYRGASSATSVPTANTKHFPHYMRDFQAPGQRELQQKQQQQQQEQQRQQQQKQAPQRQQRQRQRQQKTSSYHLFSADPFVAQHHPFCPRVRTADEQCTSTPSPLSDSAPIPMFRCRPSPATPTVPVYSAPPSHMDNGSNDSAWICENTPWQLHVATAHTRGYRDAMEDTFVQYRSDDGAIYVFGVCDGHGGTVVSEWLRDRLGPMICDTLRKGKNVQTAFAEAQAALEKEKGEYAVAGCGSTACIAVVLPDRKHYYVANCGDSRALLIDLKDALAVRRITVDHKPEGATEAKRIKGAGGFVSNADGVGRLGGILSVSRSFGDNAMRVQGLTEQPDLFGPFALDDSQALLLACDGVFDVLSDEGVALVTTRYVKPGAARPRTALVRCSAEQVRNCAFAGKSRDNISVMLVRPCKNLSQSVKE